METHKYFFHEAHFASLPNKSNVYLLANLRTASGYSKVLVAPIKGKACTVEYAQHRGEFRPEEVEFAYIPDDAELIAIHSFCKSKDEGLVIAVTLVKDYNSVKPTYCLNIYRPWESGSEFNVESISKNFCTIELDFIPHFIFSGSLFNKDGETEAMILLSSNDNKVEIFQEDKDVANRWNRCDSPDAFPEFHSLPSVLLWFHSKILDGKQRLTAMGCQDGYLRLCLVSLETNEIITQWEFQHDSAITCVQLFTERSCQEPAASKDSGSLEKVQVDFNLVVTSAMEISVIYRNVLQNGFTEQLLLEDSDKYDCTLCACVADIDWDGEHEILIGTYGQELLAYKLKAAPSEDGSPCTPVKPSQPPSDQTTLENDNVFDPPKESQCEPSYELIWKRSFGHPLLTMQYMDVTGDGLGELVVVSTKGIHILQHNLSDAADILMERLMMQDSTCSSLEDTNDI